MKEKYDVIKIECLKNEDKEYKKVIRFCTIFGILSALVSVITVDSIINYNNIDSVKNNVLYAIAFASIPSTIITFILDGLEIKEYRHFKKENKELLMKK